MRKRPAAAVVVMEVEAEAAAKVGIAGTAGSSGSRMLLTLKEEKLISSCFLHAEPWAMSVSASVFS